MQTFHGVWPALVTPFTDDDQVDVVAIERLVKYLVDKGLNGFYLCGSTGEGVFMTSAERKQVTETVLGLIGGQLPVIVHVGASSVREAEELARHAAQHGASGISSILPPVVFDERSVIPYFTAIAAAAPDLPFMPYLLGAIRNPLALLDSLSHVPNLAGTKYTGSNMVEMGQVAALRAEGWTIFSGMDEQALFARMSGAHGCIGSTMNLMGGLYLQLMDAAAKGDYAGALTLQQQANRVTLTLARFGFMGALKTALALIGQPVGAPRTPNIPLPAESRSELVAALEAAGLHDAAAL
jgi:N-acetylneuraminate lyase